LHYILQIQKEFTTTVSVDGWIRGQPTQVLVQKFEFEKEDPSLLLSRANVPVTIPMHQGIYNGDEVFYIITDASDKDYTNIISKNKNGIFNYLKQLRIYLIVIFKNFLFLKMELKEMVFLDFKMKYFLVPPKN
jgi:hypothetical protein